MAGKLAFWIAGSTMGGWIVGLVFTYFSAFLPVRNAARNPQLKIFHHPKPIDDPHILLVPKKPARTALWLRNKPAAPIIWQAIEEALPPLAQAHTPQGGRVFFNGGVRQDVLQFHLHLTTSQTFINGWELDKDRRGHTHLVLGAKPNHGFAAQINAALHDHAQRLATARGFTFVFGDATHGTYRTDQTNCLHLIIEPAS